MKNLFVTLAFLSILSINLSSTNNNEVPLSGSWGEEDKGIRSLTPNKPAVCVDGDLLLVHFPDYLANVSIIVKDSAGKEIYNSCITTPYAGYILNIPLSHQPESYTITISHPLGILTGSFQIE